MRSRSVHGGSAGANTGNYRPYRARNRNYRLMEPEGSGADRMVKTRSQARHRKSRSAKIAGTL
jgi:hypothetical protein